MLSVEPREGGLGVYILDSMLERPSYPEYEWYTTRSSSAANAKTYANKQAWLDKQKVHIPWRTHCISIAMQLNNKPGGGDEELERCTTELVAMLYKEQVEHREDTDVQWMFWVFTLQSSTYCHC